MCRVRGIRGKKRDNKQKVRPDALSFLGLIAFHSLLDSFGIV